MEEPRQVEFYHVTLTDNLSSIMEKGLIPSVGERSKKMGEHAATFLFGNEQDAEDAVTNWLGDQFEEEQQLALLRVTIPVNEGIEVIQTEGADYEFYTKHHIPAKWIQVIDKNYGY